MDRPKRRFGLRPVLGAVAMMAVVGLGVVMINRANGELAGESASRQLTFDLRVNDVSGLQEPWPMVGGLPFPEGELDDAARIRIVDAEGDEVPAQIDVVATWRDGSIRWAHAGVSRRAVIGLINQIHHGLVSGESPVTLPGRLVVRISSERGKEIPFRNTGIT